MSWNRTLEVIQSPEFTTLLEESQTAYLSDIIGKTDVEEVMDLKRRAEIVGYLQTELLIRLKRKLKVGDNDE